LLTKNRQIRTQNLLLAIGNGLFKPNLLAIPGAKNSNKIEYRFSDIKKYQNKNIVILGGGDSAVDFANTIATKSNTSVTILHRRDSFRASGSNVKLLNKNGVRIILNSVCLKISKNFLFYKNVKNNKIDKIYFDKILVQYGQNPSICLPN
jgi:thioredoxin reductase (NADPH)